MVKKSQPVAKKKSDSLTTPIIIFLAVVAVALGGYLYWMNKKAAVPENTAEVPSEAAKPTPTPTPTTLTAGSGTYNVGKSEADKGPIVTTLTLNPLDPKQNEHQTITAHLTFATPVTSATISFQSDHKTLELTPLKLVSGTTTDGDWQTSWDVDDTVLYKYVVTVTAASGDLKTVAPVAPRI